MPAPRPAAGQLRGGGIAANQSLPQFLGGIVQQPIRAVLFANIQLLLRRRRCDYPRASRLGDIYRGEAARRRAQHEHGFGSNQPGVVEQRVPRGAICEHDHGCDFVSHPFRQNEAIIRTPDGLFSEPAQVAITGNPLTRPSRIWTCFSCPPAVPTREGCHDGQSGPARNKACKGLSVGAT